MCRIIGGLRAKLDNRLFNSLNLLWFYEHVLVLSEKLFTRQRWIIGLKQTGTKLEFLGTETTVLSMAPSCYERIACSFYEDVFIL
jgi:hypothetical protein